MSIKDIIRAWKDSTYRNSLSQEQRAQLLANPIGDSLSEEELLAITGGGSGDDGCATDDSGDCSCTGLDICTEQTHPWQAGCI